MSAESAVLTWVAWYCSCGRACDGPIHEYSVVHLRQAWDHVHSGTGHAPVSSEEWDALRSQQEGELEDLLRDGGIAPVPAGTIADLVWGRRR